MSKINEELKTDKQILNKLYFYILFPLFAANYPYLISTNVILASILTILLLPYFLYVVIEDVYVELKTILSKKFGNKTYEKKSIISKLNIDPFYSVITFGVILQLKLIKIVAPIFRALYASLIDFLSAKNLSDGLSIFYAVFLLPPIVGISLKFVILYLERKESLLDKTKNILWLMLFLVRGLFIIYLGFWLSLAFNQDITNDNHNTTQNQTVISASFSNSIISINRELSAKYPNTPVRINYVNNNIMNKKQACDINSESLCARWKYVIFIMVYAGYEVSTSYIEKKLKKYFNRKDENKQMVQGNLTEETQAALPTEDNSKSVNEEVKEEVIETYAQIAQDVLTEESNVTKPTKHSPVRQRKRRRRQRRKKYD